MTDAEFEEYIKAEVFNDNSDEKNCKSDVCNFEYKTMNRQSDFTGSVCCKGVAGMKVKYIGDYYDGVSLIKGKIYDVLAIENGMYRIIDEEGYDEDEEIQGYLYWPEDFEIVGD